MNQDIIDKTEAHVKEAMASESSGHDWYHVDHVRRNALKIASKEGGDHHIIELAALLHDIADSKFNDGDHQVGANVARAWLESLDADSKVIDQVCEIISSISFSANKGVPQTLEGRIVQDADRLEALGAIGLARCFATGAKLGRPIYDPQDKNNSIQHFDDKLLKVKDLMNTTTASVIAQDRHNYLVNFLQQFHDEWNGDK